MLYILRKYFPLGLTLIVFLGMGVGLKAQSTGSITGTVVDSTGAAITDASVTVASPATGLTRVEHTNVSGNFVFPNLPIGAYTLQIAKPGFQTQKRSATELLTGQTIGLDITLSVGSKTETVEVSTDTEEVQTTTSEVATTIDKTQVQDLPLNERNPLQLTSLTPGAVLSSAGTEATQQDNTGLSVNGLRTTENNFQLDGALYENRFFDSAPILPDPDALQEFTIQATNYSSEYSGAGALVQLSTRSGTNQLHGNAFEFFRNTILNARNYFNVPPQLKPPFKLNQFGGTVGGPIIIPHIYNGRDKTFFFFSAEDLQQRSSPAVNTILVPTNAELSGNFSALLPGTNGTCPAGTGCAQLYNPYTGAIYPGNIINTPASPLSIAVANQFIVPLHANQATGAYVSFENQNRDSTQYLIKIDHKISERNQLSGRYFYNEDNFQRPFATAPLGFYAENLFRNQSLTISDTQTFSNTLTATLYVSGGRFARTQIPIAPGLVSLQGLGENVPLGTNVPIFPGIRANISGGYTDIFSGGALTQVPTTYEYKAQAVKLLGPNTISFGATFERTGINATDYSYTPGDNTFNGQRTQNPNGVSCPDPKCGSPVADFYLGLGSSFFQDNGRRFELRENRPGVYVQDDWKVSKNLTLNLGVRWDPWLPPIDKNDTLVGFEAGEQSTVAPGAPRGLLFNGDGNLQASVFRNNYKAFGPRVGFAYNVDGQGNTVIRGAYGIFYGFPEGLLYQRTDATQPVDLYLNIPNPPAWDNTYAGYPGGDPFPRAHISTSQFSTYQFLLPVSGGVLDPNSKVAYTQDYNLTVEQTLPGGFAMSLAYVGNHGEHIMASRQFNPAVCAPGAPCANLNNSTCPSCTIGNENSRRLFPGLGAVEIAQAYEYAIFNSLQLNVTRRVSKGLTLLGNIVWSKDIDNESAANEGNDGPPNPFNLNSGRGPADFDQRERANISANYLLPKFEVNRFESGFVNGWQFNVIGQFQTGLPFNVTSGTDRSLSGIGNDFADVVPNVSPKRPSGVSPVKEYFNTAAFTAAALGTFGNVHRNNITGPAYNEIDGSIFKDFFSESRIHGRFQAEAFNLLNHPNFGNPTSAFNSGTYGQITTTATGNDSNTSGLSRIFQFAVKIMF